MRVKWVLDGVIHIRMYTTMEGICGRGQCGVRMGLNGVMGIRLIRMYMAVKGMYGRVRVGISGG